MIEELSGPDVLDFILQHEDEDTAKLVLSQSKYPEIPVQLAVAQIQSRKKARKKLPEWYSTPGVLFSHGVPLEQCSSEITAKYKAKLVSGGSLVDLTGGTGIDTFYLSKQFSASTYVEQQAQLCKLAQHNFDILSTNTTIVNCKAEKYLTDLSQPVDCIYIDPARRGDHNKKVFRLDQCTPNLKDLEDALHKKTRCILVKLSPLLDLSEIIKTLKNIKEIHVVSINNECKEVLLLISNIETNPCIITVNYQGQKLQEFKFLHGKEATAAATCSAPKQYLYEPNSSIMKAGAFKSICEHFQIQKLHPNSHIYTSAHMLSKFPGRAFRIVGVEPLKKSNLKKYLPDWKANITVRNFPSGVTQIRKKTGIKEGGDTFIFATTLISDEPRLIICEKAS